jgi:hypothetical protein
MRQASCVVMDVDFVLFPSPEKYLNVLKMKFKLRVFFSIFKAACFFFFLYDAMSLGSIEI